MAKVNSPIYRLNGGEVGKRALARGDLDSLAFTAELCENMLPDVVGGVSLRPGFEFLSALQDPDFDTIRLIPFSNAFRNDPGVREDQEHGVLIFYRDRNDPNTKHLQIFVTNPDGTYQLNDLTGVDSYPWDASVNKDIQYAQVNDVMFLAIPNHFPYELRKTGPFTWDLRNYLAQVNDGPFTLSRKTIALTPVRNVNREITGILANGNVFSRDDVNSLIRLTHYFQDEERQFYSGDVGQATNSIRVTGVSNAGVTAGRDIRIDIGGFRGGNHWRGKAVLERSVGVEGNWEIVADYDASNNTLVTREGALATFPDTHRFYNADHPTRIDFSSEVLRTGFLIQNLQHSQFAYRDQLDNQIVFYRMRITDVTGIFFNNTSGNPNDSPTLRLSHSGGSTTGIARITGFNRADLVTIQEIEPFAAIGYTTDWDFGSFSAREGYPTSVSTHEGRLWWGRDDQLFGSVSDAFYSFDQSIEGDSAPVIRSLGQNTRQGINWITSGKRMVVGTDDSEIEVRASSFDEPITPLGFAPRVVSTRGTADVQAIVIDGDVIFVQRSRCRLFVMRYGGSNEEYQSIDLTELHPDVCNGATIVKIVAQRQPDTRIWCLLSNGKLLCLTYEPLSGVLAWSRHETGADWRFQGALSSENGYRTEPIKDIVIIPGVAGEEDRLFVVVQRRHQTTLERMAQIKDAIGGDPTYLLDSFVDFNPFNQRTSVVPFRFAGNVRDAWAIRADGTIRAFARSGAVSFTGGPIFNESNPQYARVVAGFSYRGRWKSSKLLNVNRNGASLLQPQKIDSVSLYLTDVSINGVRMGNSFDSLHGIADRSNGAPLPPDTENAKVFSEWNEPASPFNGDFGVDSRICIEIDAPHACRVNALVVNVRTNEDDAERGDPAVLAGS